MKRTKQILLLISFVILLTVSLSACKPTQSPEEKEAELSTAVHATLSMGATRTEIARPTDTPVPTATPVPTNTPVIPTVPQATFVSTIGYGITQSPPPVTMPTAVPPTSIGDYERADWGHSNPPDGTLFDGGATFTVMVTIVNNGTTTWNTNYYIQHVDGPKMGAQSKFNMPAEIPPTKSAAFEIEFTGPTEPGTYRSNWAVYNANNIIIGSFYFEYKFD